MISIQTELVKPIDLIFYLFVFIMLLDGILTGVFWYAEINPLVLQIGYIPFLFIKLVSIIVMKLGIELYKLTYKNNH